MDGNVFDIHLRIHMRFYLTFTSMCSYNTMQTTCALVSNKLYSIHADKTAFIVYGTGTHQSYSDNNFLKVAQSSKNTTITTILLILASFTKIFEGNWNNFWQEITLKSYQWFRQNYQLPLSDRKCRQHMHVDLIWSPTYIWRSFRTLQGYLPCSTRLSQYHDSYLKKV